MIFKENLEKLSLEAAQEIGESGGNIEEALDNLKKSLKENYEDLKLSPNPDEFLVRFLRASKFDISRAAKQVSQYFKLLHQLREIEHLLNPKCVEWVFRDAGLSVLKNRDSKGRVVILFRQDKIPASADYFDFTMAASILLVDFIHRISVDTQRIGIVILSDTHSYSFSHIRHLSPSRLVKFTKLMTQAFPVRFKGINFVRNPGIFGHLVSIFKPVFPAKIRSRLHLHGSSFESLHEQIEPEILPKYLGGMVADDEYADSEIISKLFEEQDYFKHLLSYGYA